MFALRRGIAFIIVGVVASCEASSDHDSSGTGGKGGRAGSDSGAGEAGEQTSGAGRGTGGRAGRGGAGGGNAPSEGGEAGAAARGASSGKGGEAGGGGEMIAEDPCVLAECGNGTCRSSGGEAVCVCEEGFEGEHCDEDVDFCAAMPCKNGGTCEDGLRGYTCDCSTAPGFTGERCEVNIDGCSGDPCLNDGICVDADDGFTCDCTGTGFEGQYCQDNVDDCDGSQCVNGTCVDGINAYACECEAGYEGALCDLDHDDCTPNPCKHGGDCTDQLDGYSCNCAGTGYTGPSCTEDVDECLVNNGGCSVNADCLNSDGSWGCRCKNGYFGDGAKCLPTQHGYTAETFSVGSPQCDDLSAEPNRMSDACWTDCSQGGGATNVAAIGFNFQFFGAAQDRFAMARQGYMRPFPVGHRAFAHQSYNNGPIPSVVQRPHGIIAALWTPFNMPLYEAGTFPNYVGTVKSKLIGVAPNRRLTMEWRDFRFAAGADVGTRLTFQVKLFETTNAIELHYCSLVAGNVAEQPLVRGSVATVGIESHDGLRGYNFSHRQDNSISTGRYFHFEPAKGGAGCQVGYVDCDDDPSTGVGGCEVDVLNDPTHCGSCSAPRCAAAPAGTFADGGAVCKFGMCDVGCNPGYGNCNGLAGDGCELYLLNNTQNCNSCGYYCAEGWAGGCVGGVCQ